MAPGRSPASKDGPVAVHPRLFSTNPHWQKSGHRFSATETVGDGRASERRTGPSFDPNPEAIASMLSFRTGWEYSGRGKPFKPTEIILVSSSRLDMCSDGDCASSRQVVSCVCVDHDHVFFLVTLCGSGSGGQQKLVGAVARCWPLSPHAAARAPGCTPSCLV